MARILVLDDDPDSSNLVRRIAEGLSHTAVSFTNEFEALDYATEFVPDLVILDLKLKRMNGVEVFELMRRTQPEVKGIIVTGYPTFSIEQRAVDAGIRTYLVKPVDVDILEMEITHALEDSGSTRVALG